MTEVDPRTAYLEARDAYTATRELTQAHVSIVTGVARQIEKYADGFVSASIERKADGGVHTAYDLAKWPTGEDLRRDFLSLKIAFETCKAFYERVPHDRRSSCKPPPTKLGDP